MQMDVDANQMPEIAASDQSLHCLLLIKEFSNTSPCNAMALLKFSAKHGNKINIVANNHSSR